MSTPTLFQGSCSYGGVIRGSFLCVGLGLHAFGTLCYSWISLYLGPPHIHDFSLSALHDALVSTVQMMENVTSDTVWDDYAIPMQHKPFRDGKAVTPLMVYFGLYWNTTYMFWPSLAQWMTHHLQVTVHTHILPYLFQFRGRHGPYCVNLIFKL